MFWTMFYSLVAIIFALGLVQVLLDDLGPDKPTLLDALSPWKLVLAVLFGVAWPLILAVVLLVIVAGVVISYFFPLKGAAILEKAEEWLPESLT